MPFTRVTCCCCQAATSYRSSPWRAATTNASAATWVFSGKWLVWNGTRIWTATYLCTYAIWMLQRTYFCVKAFQLSTIPQKSALWSFVCVFNLVASWLLRIFYLFSDMLAEAYDLDHIILGLSLSLCLCPLFVTLSLLLARSRGLSLALSLSALYLFSLFRFLAPCIHITRMLSLSLSLSLSLFLSLSLSLSLPFSLSLSLSCSLLRSLSRILCLADPTPPHSPSFSYPSPFSRGSVFLCPLLWFSCTLCILLHAYACMHMYVCTFYVHACTWAEC